MTNIYIIITRYPDEGNVSHLEVLAGPPLWRLTKDQSLYVADVNGGDAQDVTPDLEED